MPKDVRVDGTFWQSIFFVVPFLIPVTIFMHILEDFMPKIPAKFHSNSLLKKCYFFLFIYGHSVHLFSFRNHYNIFSGIVPCAILTAWYNVFCAKGRLHGTMLDSFVFAWYNAITAKETPQNRKEVKPHETF